MDIQQLQIRLSEHLRAMDLEALPVQGVNTGLMGYAAFRRGNYRENRGTPWENAWSDRLKELLIADGWEVDRECRFEDRPSSRERCDLVLRGFNQRVWIEVKGSWHRYVADTGGPGHKNPAYVKHLARTAHDVDKLSTLLPDHASSVILVLVGFDAIDNPGFGEEFKVVTDKLDGWKLQEACWPDPWWTGFRVRVWCWMKQSDSSATEI